MVLVIKQNCRVQMRFVILLHCYMSSWEQTNIKISRIMGTVLQPYDYYTNILVKYQKNFVLKPRYWLILLRCALQIPGALSQFPRHPFVGHLSLVFWYQLRGSNMRGSGLKWLNSNTTAPLAMSTKVRYKTWTGPGLGHVIKRGPGLFIKCGPVFCNHLAEVS